MVKLWSSFVLSNPQNTVSLCLFLYFFCILIHPSHNLHHSKNTAKICQSMQKVAPCLHPDPSAHNRIYVRPICQRSSKMHTQTHMWLLEFWVLQNQDRCTKTTHTNKKDHPPSPPVNHLFCGPTHQTQNKTKDHPLVNKSHRITDHRWSPQRLQQHHTKQSNDLSPNGLNNTVRDRCILFLDRQ